MHLGVIGLGTIGQALLERLTGDSAPSRITALVRPGGARPGVVDTVEDFIALRPDLVVECAGHVAVRQSVLPCLKAGIDVVVVSVGALAEPALEDALRAAACSGGARLILPSGAIGGIDLLAALAAGGDCTVHYTGTKPPNAWCGSPADDAVDLNALTVATTIFAGTAREAATAYPKNANVAATLALAGGGFDTTRVTLVADPAAPGNIHAYEVHSPLGSFAIRIENRPTFANARTSAATVLSVLRLIRNRIGPVEI